MNQETEESDKKQLKFVYTITLIVMIPIAFLYATAIIFSVSRPNSIEKKFFNPVVKEIKSMPKINNLQSFVNNKNIHFISAQKVFNPNNNNNYLVFTTKKNKKYKIKAIQLTGYNISKKMPDIKYLNRLNNKNSNLHDQYTDWACNNKKAIEQFLNKKMKQCKPSFFKNFLLGNV